MKLVFLLNPLLIYIHKNRTGKMKMGTKRLIALQELHRTPGMLYKFIFAGLHLRKYSSGKDIN